jgi:glycosyltransferase involved in cell wall biosynthesis
MRVAVVNWSSRKVGGVEEYVSLILAALARTGADVAFWREMDAPIDRPAVPVPPGVLAFCAAQMGADASLRALREWKPDVLYVQATKDVDLEARLLDIAPAVYFLHSYVGTCISGGKTFTRPTALPCARRFGPPCLAHYFPRGCGGNSPLTMARLYKQQSTRLALLRRYRAILTHTEHMRREMANHDLDAQVIPYPVGPETCEQACSSDGPSRLLYAGRMESLKGGLVMVDAIPRVLEAVRRPLCVVMAGDGRDRPHWEARAREVEMRTPDVQFEFTGWLPQAQVSAVMANSDLLVMPSLWPEPFGSVGPAAARHGLPAAAFAVGGISQWLSDGVSGHLAPGDPPTSAGLAGAIVQCLEDPIHHAALKAGARRIAATFTMEKHLPELMKALAPR